MLTGGGRASDGVSPARSGGAMSENPGRGWQIRGTAYFVLAVAAALGTPSRTYSPC